MLNTISALLDSGAAPTFSVDYLVVAGGGGGGGSTANNQNVGGGGGGGGYLESTLTGLSLATNYTVTIGAGGAANTSGVSSVFSSITSTGGGKGGIYTTAGANGGSGGGGGSSHSAATSTAGGTGTSGQGNAGATGTYAGTLLLSVSGGGGGADAVGLLRDGGNGKTSSISGTSTDYAGGGYGWDGAGSSGNNGLGGGGSANRGGGNRGGYRDSPTNINGAAGGSGVVYIKYADTKTITIGAGLTGTTASSGGFTVATITAGTGNVSWV